MPTYSHRTDVIRTAVGVVGNASLIWFLQDDDCVFAISQSEEDFVSNWLRSSFSFVVSSVDLVFLFNILKILEYSWSLNRRWSSELISDLFYNRNSPDPIVILFDLGFRWIESLFVYDEWFRNCAGVWWSWFMTDDSLSMFFLCRQCSLVRSVHIPSVGFLSFLYLFMFDFTVLNLLIDWLYILSIWIEFRFN